MQNREQAFFNVSGIGGPIDRTHRGRVLEITFLASLGVLNLMVRFFWTSPINKRLRGRVLESLNIIILRAIEA